MVLLTQQYPKVPRCTESVLLSFKRPVDFNSVVISAESALLVEGRFLTGRCTALPPMHTSKMVSSSFVSQDWNVSVDGISRHCSSGESREKGSGPDAQL